MDVEAGTESESSASSSESTASSSKSPPRKMALVEGNELKKGKKGKNGKNGKKVANLSDVVAAASGSFPAGDIRVAPPVRPRLTREINKPVNKKGGGGDAAIAVPSAEAVPLARPRLISSQKAIQGNNKDIREVQIIADDFRSAMIGCGLETTRLVEALRCGARYDELVMQLIAQIEYLRGQLEGQKVVNRLVPHTASQTCTMAPVSGLPVAVSPVSLPSAAVRKAPVPVSTWATIVKDKSGKLTGRSLAEKLTKEVGPTLGVRVHDTKPLRDGGVAIRSPTVAERNKVAGNDKLKELGLDVVVKDRLGVRLSVQGLDRTVKTEQFLTELKENNLRGMTDEVFQRSVRVLTKPWATDGEGTVNVTLECTNSVADALLGSGRVYILWFGLRVRQLDEVQACYRCLGFDHRANECRRSEVVCRRCGQDGHRVGTCPNAINCRNCALKGKPSAHSMMSEACPAYSAMVLRARARH